MHLSDAQRIILRELRDGPRDKHELAMECGIQPTTVKDHIGKLREEGNEIRYSKKLQKYHIDDHPTISASELDYEELATKIKNGAKLTTLADEFVTTKDELQTVLSDLENQGYSIETKTVDGEIFAYMPEGLDRRYKLSSVDDEFIFGLISDTHLGSSAEHLKELHNYYDRIESRGIEHVFHCGDISDGWKVHKGHLNEVKNSAAGWGNLRQYVIENYPNRKNVTTHFVEGNHDNKFYNRNNIRFGKLLGQDRTDLHYCGNSQATFVFDERHDINLELIHPSGGKPYCYTGDTRVLTKSYGFVRLDQVPTLIQAGDDIELATFDTENGELEYQIPERFTIMPWDGEMIEFNTQCLDLCVTPNHKMVVRKNENYHGNEGDWKLKRADEITENYKRQKWDIPVNGSWDGPTPDRFELEADHFNANPIRADAKDFLRFLGWFIAEGWTQKKGRIQLSQQDKSQIVPDIEAIGLSVHTRNAKIKTTNKALAGWLDEHVGTGSENKRIPEWVKQQSPERIEIFLETLVAGDGSYRNGEMDSYSTASRQLADDVVECLLKTGRVGNITIRERNHPKGFESQKTTYAISISESESRALTKQPERIDYNGWVYCPTVGNETLVTMRNGNVSISGNTKGYRMQTLYRERSVSDRPTIAGIGHIHGSMFAETEGVKGLYAGCWKGTTTYGKRKGHEANIGGWIIRVQISNGTVRKLVPEWIGFDEKETANRHALQDLG